MDDKKIKPASLGDLVDCFVNTKTPTFRPRLTKWGGLKYCFVCGSQSGFKQVEVINDNLAKEWGIDAKLRKAYDIRESTNCINCNASLRSNLQARAICELTSPGKKTLIDAIDAEPLKKLNVAEINSCGNLHRHLAKLPNLKYSEYMPANKDIRHEDLHNLSYDSSSLDLVLTSETLEHVPDWVVSVKEISRVLKPGGLHIFTVPAILTRKTRLRRAFKDGKEISLLPDSFHGCGQGKTSSDYIVRTEFGSDFRKHVDGLGFKTKIYYRNVLHMYDPCFVFVSTKV